MKTLDQQLAVYAAYHRNGWNKLTHYIGVPMLTFSILIPLAWLRIPIGEFELSGALIFAAAVLVWYFMLDITLAIAMVIVIAPIVYAADRVGQMPLGTGLWIFAATFVVGWIFQLIGHAIEGRRPALFDNLQQALVAPIFLLAEACFALGLKRDVQQRVAKQSRGV
jgi:uncharacterized membrane protein YGL010W